MQLQESLIYMEPFSEVCFEKGAVVREANMDIRSRAVLKAEDDVQLQGISFCMEPFSEVVFGTETSVRETKIKTASEATLNMGRSCNIRKARIRIGEDAKLSVGRGVILCNSFEDGLEEVIWDIGSQAKMEVGDGGRFFEGACFVSKNALLKIGRAFRINGKYRIVTGYDAVICVGDDCMFSWFIKMRGTDGHTIFDVKTGKNINCSDDVRKNKKIMIGNHVWLGEGCEILYDTRIGDGSIIGAMSLVKSKIPNNCIAAGIPARVIREDVAWCREYGAENMTECIPEAYRRYTEKTD